MGAFRRYPLIVFLIWGKIFFVFLIRFKEIGEKSEDQQDCAGGDCDIQAGRMLNVVGDIAEVRDSKDGSPDQVFEVDGSAICRFIGIAFGVKVLILGIDIDDTVGWRHIVRQNVRYNIADFYLRRVDIFYIDEWADGIFGLHGAWDDGEDLNVEKSDTDEQYRKNNDCDNKQRRNDIPNFL